MTGSRGPLPKPAALKALEGNPGKRALDLSAGVNPRVEVPSAPRHLGKEARKEWARITPVLEELGLISGLDRAALALYCQAVGRLSELETAFNGMVARLVDTGVDYSDAVYQASYSVTPSGYARQIGDRAADWQAPRAGQPLPDALRPVAGGARSRPGVELRAADPAGH